MKEQEKIWLEARNSLRMQLNEEEFNRWIRSVMPLDFDGNRMLLGVSDDFFADWLKEHYQKQISDALRAAANRELSFEFETVGLTGEEFSDPPSEPSPRRSPRAGAVRDGKVPNCHGRFTFNTFVVGDGNTFAHAAALAVSQDPGKSFNPLFVYGGTGLGKTHLLHAVAHSVTAQNRALVVECLTCENLMNQYLEGLQTQKLNLFRKRFRRADLLLIDDVHFLSKKLSLQEEFFNTFNTLYNNEKQIMLTSDRSPSEIDGLESRLVSRFENGLTTDIQPPALETRLAILKKKCASQKVEIPEDVLYFIASRITSNVRRLEGALVQLAGFARISGVGIDLKITEKLLAPMLMQEKIAKVTIEKIMKKVAEYFDLRVSDLTGSKRPKNIATSRMVAMYLSRELTDKSLPEIGEAFGGRNHATVIHAINKIKKTSENDRDLSNTLTMLRNQLQT